MTYQTTSARTWLAQEYARSRDEAFSYSEHHLVGIGYLAPVFVLATFIDELVGEPSVSTFYIRLVVAILMLPLIFKRSRLLRTWSYWPDYWIAICTVALPFSFGLMLTLNAATTPIGMQVNQFWVIQYLVAIFLFVQLLSVVGLTLILWMLSVLICGLALVLVENPNIAELNRTLVFPATAYLTAVAVGSLFNRNSEIVRKEKTMTASVVSANIAHELRTPLATIRGYTHGLEKFLPDIFRGYEAAEKEGLVSEPLSEGRVKALKSALGNIGKEVIYSNTVIDMLLVATNERPTNQYAGEECSAAECATEAINRYPFNSETEKRMVTLSVSRDFLIRAPSLIIIHLVFNLIKNAIPHALRSKARKIHIEVGADSDLPTIVVRDSGAGIKRRLRRKIFERFYTTQIHGQGSGIGLSFCKITMESLGGNVICNSDASTFCEFILIFPASPTAYSKPFAKVG